jgi:hypothetical protein
MKKPGYAHKICRDSAQRFCLANCGARSLVGRTHFYTELFGVPATEFGRSFDSGVRLVRFSEEF